MGAIAHGLTTADAQHRSLRALGARMTDGGFGGGTTAGLTSAAGGAAVGPAA
ncbi:hypothetical protein [Streptomyces sp. JNUCC 63]